MSARRTIGIAIGVGVVALGGCGSGSTMPDAAMVPAYSHQPRLVATDDGQNDLAIASLDPTPSVFGYSYIGLQPMTNQGPHHLAASPDAKTLYVNLSNFAPASGLTGKDPGWLLAVDAATYARTASVQVDRDPGDVVVTRDGKTAYVSHYDLVKLMDQLNKGLPEEQGFSTVAIVDTASMTVAATFPVCATAHGLVLSDDEKTLYVACSLADQLAVVDVASRTASRVVLGPDAGAIGQPALFPYAVTRSPSDGTIWISCNGSSGGWSGVRVYDPAKKAMDPSREVPLAGVAMFGDWLPDGKTLVLPHQGDDKVSLIDTAKSMETAVIALPAQTCLRAHEVRVEADGRLAHLVCEGDHVMRKGSAVTLDLAAHSVLGFAELGLYSDGFVLLPPAP